MGIKLRLTIMNFLEFFIWGSWLISMGSYMALSLGFSGLQIGAIYATMGIASMFMPGLLGIVADRWVNAERVLGACHLIGAAVMFFAATATDYTTLYVLMLINALVYMPTIALNNAVSYNLLQENKYDVVKAFPPIRVWGTVGFIAAMWAVDFMGWTRSHEQLYVSAAAALILGIYAFSLPPTRPQNQKGDKSWVSAMG
ncbi:MAG TPA: MFS transporter, partial [Flavobacteriaceae bacterium]|nr:MFS transporter [Flavobacteriaceae bacterium]